MNFKRYSAFYAFPAVLLTSNPVFAQHDGHRIVRPEDLKWENAASLPPGAKVAMIDGRINQEGPIIFRVKLPANLDADVRMSTLSGGLKTDFPLQIEEPERGPGRRATGRIGGGSRNLKLSTTSGSVSLLRM